MMNILCYVLASRYHKLLMHTCWFEAEKGKRRKTLREKFNIHKELEAAIAVQRGAADTTPQHTQAHDCEYNYKCNYNMVKGQACSSLILYKEQGLITVSMFRPVQHR